MAAASPFAAPAVVLRRLRVPDAAALLFAGVGTGVGLMTIALLRTKGQQGLFFYRGDAHMYWLTARDLFGTGRGYAALHLTADIPYRYGRVGLPLLGWLFAFGRPNMVGSTMIAVNVVAIASVAGLAATLVADYGGNPAAATPVLLVPGLLLLTINVVTEPLLIALILLAYVLDRRGRAVPARCVLAYAILTKEIAVLALLPWAWRALRGRDRRALAGIASTLVPYALWCAWLRVRIGEIPLLAHTANRSDAIALPFAGIHAAIAEHSADHVLIIAAVLATVALGLVAAAVARDQLGGLALSYALPALCLGVSALRYEGEALRLLAIPQVFTVVALAAAWSRPRARAGLARSPAADEDRPRADASV